MDNRSTTTDRNVRPWNRYFYRFFYIGVFLVGVLALQSVLSYLLTLDNPISYGFTDTLFGKFVIAQPLIFWPIFVASLILAGVGWRLQSQSKRLPGGQTYAEKAKELIDAIAATSQKADDLLREMEEVGQQREARIAQLNRQTEELASQERILQERVGELTKQDISALLQTQARSGSRTNLFYFIAGVVAPYAITLALHYIFKIG